MNFSLKPLSLKPLRVKAPTLLLATIPLLCDAHEVPAEFDSDTYYGSIVVTGVKPVSSDSDLGAQRAANSDTATMLRNYPGISLYTAGGISSLPVLHGLADDRIKIQVNGMDLMPSCPNHMNPPLSLVDPSYVGAITVMAGITPVSVGGDSIAGTIQVSAPVPEFASSLQQTFVKGQAGTFYRSNGDAHGANLSTTYATETFNLTYNGSTAQSNDVSAARDFKPAGYAAGTRTWLAGDVIGSTAYKAENNQLDLAMRHEEHLLEFSASLQDVPYELFPTQRMDMTKNLSKQFNLHYQGHFQWGEFDARAYEQLTSHAMNFGADKQFQYGTAAGMPMNTEGKTRGVAFKATIPLSEMNAVKLGTEYINYQLNDWWPPATATMGMMGPSTFQNINNGQRDRTALFAEWGSRWSQTWQSQLGARSETLNTNTGDVQGYNNMSMYVNDAATFNAQNHQRTDHNLDLTALMRYTPTDTEQFEFGYAQKTRSPNLYERYTWAASGMAAIMNNFVGDGNGYVGNQNLKPEVAHTVSATLDLHGEDKNAWQFKLTPYYTYVTNFIDAQRCPLSYSSNCTVGNLNATTGFVTLQYDNQTAQIYGADISGFKRLGMWDGVGSLKLTGVINYTRGENLSSGDNLYNITPLNAKFGLVQDSGKWANTLEWQLVAEKNHVSAVRNENQTAGYGLFNLRSTYQWKQLRVDVGVDNLFNRFYEQPLGGAYVGQGATMGINSIPWGIQVPGYGRSVNTALSVQF